MVEMEGQLILTDVGVGDMVVAARFTEDGELYRGKVISITVLSIDYIESPV